MADGLASRTELELGQTWADVVILTVLPEEYEAVLACLREPRVLRGNAERPNTYAWQLGTIDSSLYGAAFSVAVGKGTPTASYGALAARQAVALFDPKYVVFVGVGGGFTLDGQCHGDVAVSSVVVGYEYGKVDTGGFSPRGDFTYRGDEGLIRVAEAAIARGEAWWRTEDNVGRSPRARTGMIASGDKLIDDPDETFFAGVRARWPKLLAVEMEGAGVAAAMHDAQADHRGGRFVLIRGISDMPHAKAPGEEPSTGERDAWKRVASRNAARFLAHLITAWWPVPPRARPASAGEEASPAARGSGERFTVGPAGFWRYTLDRLAPRLHGWLCHIGAVETPPEYADITAYMRELKALLEQDIADRTKVYVPLHARTVPRAPAAADDGDDDDQFVRPIHQVIRVILGSLEGGDSATPELAMVNRQSRVVRNLMRTLGNATEPLILLGDPGTGKSMTLQRVACAMIEVESRRVFPTLTLYVPLGEFHVAGSVSHRDVLAHVRGTLPPEVRRWVDALDHAGRLVILFDGMDEMSRERYTEHTEALSAFAGSRHWYTRTLFSCRIADFSPRFIHRRYVLVPFNRGQIFTYLRDYFRSASEPVIEGERWPLRRLARRLSQRDLPVDANNPFVLWLLCHHLSESGRWPNSRIELLRNFLDKTYDRKRARRESASEREEDTAWPGQAALEAALAELAFLITERNRGRAIAVEEWAARAAETEDVTAVIRVGRTLGVLAESKDAGQVRFDHHRLQEYFTALHLCRAQTSVAWLDKLDVPRWQETMINLVLLGHGESAVRVLADALGEAVNTQVSAWAEFEAEVDRRREQAAAAPEQSAASAAASESAAPAAAASESGEANATASGSGEANDAGGENESSVSEASKDVADDETMFPVPLVEPLLTASEEILLGDRTELASRLVREASISPAVTEELQPVFRRAVGVLIKEGNPVTQVKMMRASVHLADSELHDAMRPLLASDIAWVRAQALLLLAEGQRGMGVNLASEIGFDLARGSLISSLPSYVKAIVRSRQGGAAWSLCVGVAASVMQLALFVAVAAVVYGSVHAWQIWERLFGLPIGPSRWGVFGVVAVLAMVASQFVRQPRYRGVVIVGAMLLLLSAEYYGPAVWAGEPMSPLYWLGTWFMTGVGAFALYPEFYALHVVTLSLTAAVYCALTWRIREQDSNSSLRSMIRVSEIGSQANGALFGLGLQAMFATLILLDWLLKPYAGIKSVVSEVVLVAFVGLPGIAMFYSFIRWLRSPKPARTGGFSIWGMIRRFAVIVVFLAAAVLVVLVLMGLGNLGEFALTNYSRGTSLTTLLVLVAGVGYLGAQHLRWLYFSFRPRMYGPRSFTPAEWQQRIRTSKPARQAELIARTDHQSLGSTPAEFLGVLDAVEPAIQKEPALSTYWQHRAELEQVLKQERQG